MKLYGAITKIEAQDDGAIKVVGIASTGAIDDADERVLPAAMKAALPAYMRFGALREMHGLSAAGATLSAEVGEDGATRIEALVVDPVAVKKVQHGVYRGFSIGGKVLARDPTDRKIITKLKLNEISLVDRPCNPEAVIDMWKAGGQPAGPSNVAVIERAIAMARAAGKAGRHSEFVVKARQTLLDEGADAPADDEPIADDNALPAEGDDQNALTDQEHIQAAHDHLVALGARCDHATSDKVGGVENLAKVLADNARLSGEVAALSPHVDDLRRTIETLERRLEDLASQPVPPRAIASAARAVTKGEDANPGERAALTADELHKYLDALPREDRGRIELRAALRQPFAVGR